MLDEGVHATLEDLARAKGVATSYASRPLRLTLLTPEIVEVILDGRPPAALQLDDLLEGFPLVADAATYFRQVLDVLIGLRLQVGT
jgi:hypothetical protein